MTKRLFTQDTFLCLKTAKHIFKSQRVLTWHYGANQKTKTKMYVYIDDDNHKKHRTAPNAS